MFILGPVFSEYECPVIHSGETLTDRKSTFQAHLASLFYKQQVKYEIIILISINVYCLSS